MSDNDDFDEEQDPSESEESENGPPAKKQKNTLQLAISSTSGIKPPEAQCANFTNCGKTINKSRPGPHGTRLCYPCGHRYKTAHDAALAADEDTADEWQPDPKKVKKDAAAAKKAAKQPKSAGKGSEMADIVLSVAKVKPALKPLASGKKRGRPFKEPINCSNCGDSIQGSGLNGPDEAKLCRTCGQRYIRAKAAADKAKVECGDEWKQRKDTGGKPKDQKECKLCGTHAYDELNNDELCDVCEKFVNEYKARDEEPPVRSSNREIPSLEPHSHALITDLAARSFRDLHPGHDPSNQDLHQQFAKSNYDELDLMQLRAECRSRGIVGRSVEAGNMHKLIEYLQISDARNGLLPRPRPGGAAIYLNKSFDDLEAIARQRGYFKQKGGNKLPRSSEAFADFLIEQDEGNPNSIIFLEDDQDTLNAIALMYLRDLSASIQGNQDTAANEATAQTLTHTTHNRGIVGSPEALTALQESLMRGLLPTETSAIGYLCGPLALANSIQAMRRSLRTTEANRPALDTTAGELMHQLMELLFTNYRRGVMQHEDVRGIPTPRYTQYMNRTFGHLEHDNRTLYNYYYDIHTALRNLDVQQLVAMLTLAHESGLIQDSFGLTIVTDAHFQTMHDGNRREIRAYARTAREPENGAPALAVLNNMTASRGEYNHFESFTLGGRIDPTMEWGLRHSDTAGTVKMKTFNPLNPTSQQTETERLKAAIRSLRQKFTERMRKFTESCDRCRLQDVMTCVGESPCNNCTKAKTTCTFSNIALPTPFFPRESGDVPDPTEQDVMHWNGPLYNRESILEMSRKFQASPQPEGEFFLCVGTARVSTNPGMQLMWATLNDLYTTTLHYDQLLTSGLAATSVGFRPGGVQQPVPMQRLLKVVARHGAKKIPSATGNLNDPYLIAFVNHMDAIMAPGNQNLPLEIHFLMMGMPGWSVPISGWGTRTSGFVGSILARDQANNTNVLSTMWIVVALELHVVNGSAISIAPGRSLNGFNTYLNKAWRKYSLLELVDRQALRDYAATHNRLFPHTPYVLPMSPNDQILDDFLTGWEHEDMWRNGQTDLNTVPSSTDVAARQNKRNSPPR